MEKEKIAKIAYQPTRNILYEIIFSKTESFVGFFEGNKLYDEFYQKNIWKFVLTPNKTKTEFNGTDVVEIKSFIIP